MVERNLLDQDEPLFLDEPPGAPRHVKPASASIDELFADEDAPNPWTTISAPPDQQEAPQSDSNVAASASQAEKHQQADQRFTTSTMLLLIMLAAVLGFSAASALLR